MSKSPRTTLTATVRYKVRYRKHNWEVLTPSGDVVLTTRTMREAHNIASDATRRFVSIMSTFNPKAN